MNTEQKWNNIIEKLDFACQPIVNFASGELFGVEVLLRNYEMAGFKSIGDVFDNAFEEDYLCNLDLCLRSKAIEKFKKLEFYNEIKLFYNLDNRVLESNKSNLGIFNTDLHLVNIDKSSFIFEVSERHQFSDVNEVNKLLINYKEQGYNIALDDFGSGFANLQELFHIEADIIKIDRFFIEGIEKSCKKQLILKTIVNLVHDMNGLVVAEGVETVEEFDICKKLKCDLIQGYFVAYPTQIIDDIKRKYIFEEKKYVICDELLFLRVKV